MALEAIDGSEQRVDTVPPELALAVQETMNMAQRFRITAGLVALAAVALSPAAMAQAEGGDDKGYGYEFEDDPLNAGGFGPNDATIRVRPKAARTTLIRPRTTFVPEMLKSVENL
jgi:hypothetical protein